MSPLIKIKETDCSLKGKYWKCWWLQDCYTTWCNIRVLM